LFVAPKSHSFSMLVDTNSLLSSGFPQISKPAIPFLRRALLLSLFFIPPFLFFLVFFFWFDRWRFPCFL